MKQAAVVASWALAILVGCSPVEGPPQVAVPDAQDTPNVDALQVTEPEIVARRELVASDVDPAVEASVMLTPTVKLPLSMSMRVVEFGGFG